ncbi:MAG: class I SAM-dependent methyltransferase [Alphaproteobacteria bacterium]
MSFVNCQEFASQNSVPRFVPLNHPRMHVEYTASAHEIETLKERIRQAWTHLGAVRPHHSVLTNPLFLGQNLDEAASKMFWASGEGEAESIRLILERHGFTNLEAKKCIEYGCGVGRVTLPLARIFARVSAYDISTTHLSLAKERASEGGCDNIEFHLCTEELDIEDSSCDFFYSRIVFQHNPPPLMRELVQLALRSLRSGGIAIFQLPTYAIGYRFILEEYMAKDSLLDMEMHCLPQEEIFRISADADCSMLEVREDGSVGRVGQWISNTFIVRHNAPPEAREHKRQSG